MEKMEKIFTALGTVNHIAATFDESERDNTRTALDSVERYITGMDDRLSVFKPDSEIARINRNAGVRDTLVGRDTFDLLRLCARYAEQTGGAFDVTTKPLTEPENAGAMVDFRDVLLNGRKLSVRLRCRGEGIHLGGIAKGYAVDRTAEILTRYGIRNAVINLGGTVRNCGIAGRVGIRNPFERGRIALALESVDEAVVTSGLYERGHHIFDPRTGKPAESDVASVTVVGKDGAAADAAATACMVLGFREGAALLGRLELEGVFILRGGGIFATEGIKDRVIQGV